MVLGYQNCVLERNPLNESVVSADGTNVGQSANRAGNQPAKISYLAQRLDALRRAQNPDGGWGYFPGKTSWLEPTAYAAMALHGEPAADRAAKLLASWQTAEGGWRPCAAVAE